MKRGRPIKPDEVSEIKKEQIPEFVFDAFNELIFKNYKDGQSKVLQKDVVGLIIKNNKELKSETIYENNWLDVEDVYRKEGWMVKYDKPAYCETYAAYFVFSKK